MANFSKQKYLIFWRFQNFFAVFMLCHGLWDNLFDEDVLKVVAGADKNSLEIRVKKLMNEATRISRTKTGSSPFSMNKNAYKSKKYGYKYNGRQGGKVDDTTVAVSIVV